MAKLVKSFWFNRFRVEEDGAYYIFTDMLYPNKRILEKSEFDSLTEESLYLSFFKKGFVRVCIQPFPEKVSSTITNSKSFLFWQFPCRTEAVAFEKHLNLESYVANENCFNFYIGLPWATWIDAEIFDASAIGVVKTRLLGLVQTLKSLGARIKVHTVCQHVYWEKFINVWRDMGITDLWLSHLHNSDLNNLYDLKDIQFHPWSLYAVNVEDKDRRNGLIIAKDPSEKKYLASFIGAHYEHYISDVRPKLTQFDLLDDFYIRVSDKWHFHDVVYRHQINKEPIDESYKVDESVFQYNSILSDSVFSLCPSGAGPNSLRLWESMASGSIPVLLGKYPAMPEGGSLKKIDWDSVVLKVADDDLCELPDILKSLSRDEVLKRQRMGLEAYYAVKNQTCF